jgi:hypothetical protein
MEQDKLKEIDSPKSINRKISINLVLFITMIILVFVIGCGLGILFIKNLTTFPKEKTGTDNFIPTTSLDKEENLAKAAYLRILSLTGNLSRTWRGSNKNGYDICGYTEIQIKEFIDIKSEDQRYYKNGWDVAEWSPGCKYLFFELLLNGGRRENWLFDNVNKKKFKLPEYEFFGFVNDNLIMTDGLDTRMSYPWEAYKLFNILENKIVADIGLSNYRYRNPAFPWSFNYGSAWELLHNESGVEDGKYLKIVFKVNDWTKFLRKKRETVLNFDSGILTSSSEKAKPQLKVEFYSYTPEFNKGKYERQIEITGPLSGMVRYYPLQSINPSDNLVSCDVWYVSEGLASVPAAIRLSNKDSEKDCVYDIQMYLINRFFSLTDEFEFAKEF